MSNTSSPVDISAVLNSLIAQGAGANLTATDLSKTITVAQVAQLYGTERITGALSEILGRTLIAIRPYKNYSFRNIETDSQTYGIMRRKISYFSSNFQTDESWNYAGSGDGYNLKDGVSIDMFKIHKQYPLEMRYGGIKVLEKVVTRFLYQYRVAFKDLASFNQFVQGLAIEVNNSIQQMKESRNRAIVLNFIGGLYNTGTSRSKVNLTQEFNTKFGTTYTSAQLRTTHLKEFSEYLASRIKYDADMMEKDTDLFHLTPVQRDDSGNTLQLLRHTPKSEQRLMLLAPFMYDIEKFVMPEIFHDGYLRIENYEAIPYWQSAEAGKEGYINVTPNQLKISTGFTENGNPVTTPYVIGVLYDRPACVSSFRLEDTIATPYNAAGAYYNTYFHFANDFQNDFTENGILYYMEDAAA